MGLSCCSDAVAHSGKAHHRLALQVDGLTRLMLGGTPEEDAPGKGKKENRRETWAPGVGKLLQQSLTSDTRTALQDSRNLHQATCKVACPAPIKNGKSVKLAHKSPATWVGACLSSLAGCAFGSAYKAEPKTRTVH